MFLGIYGGSLVDSNEESLANQKKKLKQDLVENLESTAEGRDSTRPTVQEEIQGEKKMPTLFQDILGVIVLETPIVLVVVGLGLLLGHLEGWDPIRRYVRCYPTWKTIHNANKR